jgi:hypothetical protein
MSQQLVDQGASDLAPSLDLYAISLPNEEGGEELLRCPRKEDYRWQHEDTGEIRPARCRANFCPWCGPVNASLVAGAISLAGVERMGTLTQVGDDWQTMRARMFRLAYDLRRSHELAWAWHIEPNPKGTGHHAHFFQRGDFLPQRELSRLADSRGMGKVADIRKWETKGKAGYGLKLAGVSYGLKQAQAEDTMRTYLRANGGRLVHTTRAFWRDLDGQAVSQREAMVAWARRAGTEDDGKWQLVRVA